MVIYIYTLSHPITGEVRYVGKTNRLKTRYQTHITTKSKTHCSNWIKSLKTQNLLPLMEIVDEVGNDWVLMEQYWIAQFKVWGFNLTNQTAGGEGMYGYTPKHTTTKEWAEHSSKVHKGKIISTETRKKISIALTGNTLSIDTRGKIRTSCITIAEIRSSFILHVFYKKTNKYFGTFRTGSKLARVLGCNQSCVTMCLSGQNKSVKGLIIKRINCIK
jgi:hypothetical protein